MNNDNNTPETTTITDTSSSSRPTIARMLLVTYAACWALCIVTLGAMSFIDSDSRSQSLIHSGIGVIALICAACCFVLAAAWIIAPFRASHTTGFRGANAVSRLAISLVAGYVLYLPLLFTTFATFHWSFV